MNVARIHCLYCQSLHRQIRWGRTPAGSQKYRCHGCARVYTPHRKLCGHPPETREAALLMHREGQSSRQIGRLLGVHHQTIINWIYAAQPDGEQDAR